MSVQTTNASVPDPRRVAGPRVLLMLSLLAPSMLLPAAVTAANVAQSSAAGTAFPSAAAPANGSARPGHLGPALRSLADRQISMDEAVDMAQRRYNARVVRAEVSERGGRRVYLLRLLSDDGRVFNVRVDAATGNIQ
jgi:uncharacterized membrane protein YkoI